MNNKIKIRKCPCRGPWCNTWLVYLAGGRVWGAVEGWDTAQSVARGLIKLHVSSTYGRGESLAVSKYPQEFLDKLKMNSQYGRGTKN